MAECIFQCFNGETKKATFLYVGGFFLLKGYFMNEKNELLGVILFYIVTIYLSYTFTKWIHEIVKAVNI